jgi:hypothetical protein
MKAVRSCPILFIALLLGTSTMANENNALSRAEAEAGWTLLFDGKDLSQWRNYGKAEVGDGWRVEDGTMVLTGEGGGDIVTRDVYEDFELVLDWRISSAGNSGIFILVEESDAPIYHRAPEIQILDNERHSDREIDSHRSGALYDLVAPHPSAHKPQGEWNTVRIRLHDGLLNIWQNEVPTATVVIGSSTWDLLVANSKFADWEGFGTGSAGRIGLQDHGDKVWFRNLKIREL